MNNTPHTLVLGAGIVGRAAAWDLDRRGHRVTLADVDGDLAVAAASALGLDHSTVDAADREAVVAAMAGKGSVISAVPYSYGAGLASAATEVGCHYFDFGGNPTIVKEQLQLDTAAVAGGVAVVPDCGLAPGLANVLAAGLIEETGDGPIDSVQIRVGCLPQRPVGALNYQLTFYAGGLINEYAEPCEVISNGVATTVEPLGRFETIQWDGWGPLEAFSTAGGTSTMCQDYEGRVTELEYKTLRFPGHGIVFAALRELGFFDTERRPVSGISPRTMLLDLLNEHLPSGGPDLALVRVEVRARGRTLTMEVEDVDDGTFSALARTTAFPTTALCDLITRDELSFRGAAAMSTVAPAGPLLDELTQVGITARRR